MERIFIGLGSNRGNRRTFLQEALQALGEIPGWSVHAVSSVYETEPFGFKDQPYFLNAVAEVHATVEPEEALALLKAIERILGRTRSERWGPREIDLDLLYVGNAIREGAEFRLPHPELAKRKFVLEPLAAIAPDFIDPVSGKTILELLNACTDTSSVTRSEESLQLTLLER